MRFHFNSRREDRSSGHKLLLTYTDEFHKGEDGVLTGDGLGDMRSEGLSGGGRGEVEEIKAGRVGRLSREKGS